MVAPDSPDFWLERGSQTASDHINDHRSGARSRGGRKRILCRTHGSVLRLTSVQCCARPTKAQHWSRGGRKRSQLGMAHAKLVGSVLRLTSVQCCARPTEAERGRAVVMVAPDCPDFRLERGSQTASNHRAASRSGARSLGGRKQSQDEVPRFSLEARPLPTTGMSTEAERGCVVVGS